MKEEKKSEGEDVCRRRDFYRDRSCFFDDFE
jgi:hypothetical protein